jgi:acetyl-CoA synthetase
MIQPNVPSMFSTPVLGSKISLLDPDTKRVLGTGEYVSGCSGTTTGELVIQPPSIGLSTVLLNRNHFDCYYSDMPMDENGRYFRRHGDAMEAVRDSDMSVPYYRALGRCDDTMNLGGIKISSVEIERVCNQVSIVKETAAIAVTSGGPCKLVIYAVLNHCNDDVYSNNDEPVQPQQYTSSMDLKATLQKSIKIGLNPLFGIHDVVITDSLPRTASNKIMRRLLRDEYCAN